jgi:transposase
LEEAIWMIVVGVDVHKRSLTAVAVDEAGRQLAEQTVVAVEELLAWAASLSGERLWAIEDCRQLTRALERDLLAVGERLGGGPVSAAKLLAEIGPIERFQTDAQLARHAGVAPLEASSGRIQRHRLDRGGNRQLNCALHRIAITQGRFHPPARAYLDRKHAEGKSRREALRCLKRQLARTVYTTLKNAPPLT